MTIDDKTGSNGKDAFGDVAAAWPSRSGPIVICACPRGGSPTAELIATTFQAAGALAAPQA